MKAAILAFLIGFVLAAGFWPYQMLGKDVGQWAAVGNPPEISQWYKSLMRPDYGYWTSSCCAESDAYWCDEISTRLETPKVDADHPGNTTEPVVHNYCAITDDRDDGPLHRPHRPLGELHEIPPEKMKFNPNDPQKNLGNPTGHSIIFLSSTEGQDAVTYCFVPNGGA